MNSDTHPDTIISSTPNFTKFYLVIPLAFHRQKWTFTSRLYRDGQLIETWSKKSPMLSQYDAVTTFTEQPNDFVRGHIWKLEWTYHNNNGATSYKILK